MPVQYLTVTDDELWAPWVVFEVQGQIIVGVRESALTGPDHAVVVAGIRAAVRRRRDEGGEASVAA